MKILANIFILWNEIRKLLTNYHTKKSFITFFLMSNIHFMGFPNFRYLVTSSHVGVNLVE